MDNNTQTQDSLFEEFAKEAEKETEYLNLLLKYQEIEKEHKKILIEDKAIKMENLRLKKIVKTLTTLLS